MKKAIAFMLCALLLTGCGAAQEIIATAQPTVSQETEGQAAPAETTPAAVAAAQEYVSRFDSETAV